MLEPNAGPPEGWTRVASSLREPLIAQLAADEIVLAYMISDIDRERFYRSTLLVLTNRRFLSCSIASGIQEWPLSAIEKLKTKDRGGLGTLEILGTEGRLGVWHYTIAQGPSALVLGDRFEELSAKGGHIERPEEDEIPMAEEHEPPPDTAALFRLWQFARPHLGWMLLALGMSLTASIAEVKTIEMTEPLVDLLREHTVGPGQLFAKCGFYLAVMLGAAVAAWLLGWGQGALLAWISERITGDLRRRTYSHLQRLSLEYFGGKRTGDLMSRISSDSDRLCAFLSDSIVDFIANSILLMVVTYALFSSNFKVALVALLPFPFIVWLMYYARDKLQIGFQASSRAWGAMSSVLADTIPGIRVVKAFAQEDREIERFSVANELVVSSNNRVNRLWTFFWPLITFLNHLGVFVVWVCGVWLIGNHDESGFSVGALAKVVLLSERFYSKLEMMSRIVNASQRAAASAQRIFEILDRVSSVPEPAKPINIDKLRGDLEFRHVGFRYGNRKVIRDFSLKIEAGEMIGLVGHTGAGKSTLINLVCRFFDVAEGAILADGIDIRSYNVEQYRRNVGIVLQDPFLFYGTIAENIAYGSPTATREQIIEAAKAARAHEFILQLADGYDSLVGERGQSLSGGERQRISIARALLIDPRILILDEATSALDSTTERQIQEALQNLVRGRTTIAIAHRLSTLRQANRIMVIDRGRLMEIGTHDQLLKRDGAYAALHRAQQELTKDIGW
ncbi:cyanophycin metabolism-associated ABC transporter [Schlesneria paludicola]|uniref:cyanophycin metabolism-associated ABC transporter n=1 Tax=Schlesneria paludicola TaxID=360056 RepID=UPI00029AF9FC|nr:ABC transporter ATP-binding protein [Schlesneria paludicola]